MTHDEKLQALYRHAEAFGIDRATAAPPLWRLLWRMGVPVPPPLFLGFWPLALGTGVAFGVLWGLAMLLLTRVMPMAMPGWAAALAGACFGLLFAAVIRVRAGRLHLPAWSVYDGPSPRG